MHVTYKTFAMKSSLQFSQEEINQIANDRFTYGCLKVQKRLFAIHLKITTNYSDKEISDIVDCNRNSIRVWVDKVDKEGLHSLYIEKNHHPFSDLEPFREIIEKELDEHPVQSAKEAAEVVERLTGIRRSPGRIRQFLHSGGYKLFKMKPIPAKADVEVQKAWVEKKLNPFIEKAKKGKCCLLFMDASHFVLGAFVCYVWSKVALFLKTSAGRNRINVLGAVNAVNQELTTLINTTFINATVIIEFLNLLKSKYADTPIVIVLDNARYQHCNLVTSAAEKLGIQLLFLPPYSPNLNIIERLWKLTKKKILYTKYYDTPKKFHEAICNFMQNVNTDYKDELESLLTLNFQFWEEKNAA